MADRELKQFHRLDFTKSHDDVGTDTLGREVVVMQNSRNDYLDLIPVDWHTKPILNPDDPYAGTQRVPLLRLYFESSAPGGLRAPGRICRAGMLRR